MEKQQQLYSGKAKTIFATTDPNRVVMAFRDDTSAFNGKKLAKLAGKGQVNNAINAFIMDALAAQGIATHFERLLSETESLVKRLDMVPVEVVVRNFAAGSLTKRLQIKNGTALQPPVLEFFYKSDELGDPMINESHIATFGWASAETVAEMKTVALQVNSILQPLFKQASLDLVDYKLEFGYYEGQLTLGDEFTPDGCRLWDSHSKEILDKDRFRQDLGNVIESYQVIAERLGVVAAVCS